jgi:hypothetical protein
LDKIEDRVPSTHLLPFKMERNGNNCQIPPQRHSVLKCRAGAMYSHLKEDKSFVDELKKLVHSLAPRVWREDSTHFGCFATWKKFSRDSGNDDQLEAWGHDGDVVNAYMFLQILSLCRRHNQDFRCAVQKVSE